MKQIVLEKHGGANAFKIWEKPDPKPAKGEVLINIKATGINFADILARKGIYPDMPPKPCVLGLEISGVIEAVGEGVDEANIGKSILTLTNFGGYADYITLPVDQIFEKPDSISYEEAAAIPVNYLTAYQLIVVMGSLKKDESVLIHNAGGGVGLAAIDIAKKIGATTYGTASSMKHVYLMKRGLDHVIDYRTQNWLQVIQQFTQGKGVELIIDPLGGKNWSKSYKALRHTGRLGVFGISAAVKPGPTSKLTLLKLFFQTPKFSPIRLMNANKCIFGVHIGHLQHEQEKVKEWMQIIVDGIKEDWVRPHVDKSFAFEEIGEAHKYIEKRKNLGKVVLVP